VISLFAGCGGSSLGYSMAGYRELLAVEWDKHAVETFRLNFPGVQEWQGDIADLSVEECLRITGLQPGQLDVLDGSPPCQGFSTAGKRKMDDGRNQLFREYIRLLRGLQPKVLIMENVSGMVKGKMKLIFVEILKELKASGYHVSARLMNAMYFGVPQSRQRMIFIGVREDLWNSIQVR
jgi:DNA (cytosine-5)-methyltransferase 1